MWESADVFLFRCKGKVLATLVETFYDSIRRDSFTAVPCERCCGDAMNEAKTGMVEKKVALVLKSPFGSFTIIRNVEKFSNRSITADSSAG